MQFWLDPASDLLNPYLVVTVEQPGALDNSEYADVPGPAEIVAQD